jgi:hypothetical protein
LVKDSQLALFDVKEISGHSEDPAIFDKATIFGTSVVNGIGMTTPSASRQVLRINEGE